MPCPIAFWGPEAKSLGRFSPFPLSLLSPFPPFSKVERSSSRPSLALDLGGAGGGSCVERERGRGARRRQPWLREGPFMGSLSPCSPPHCTHVCVVWAIPGCSIPVVYLPSDDATAVRIVTSEEASPRLDANLSRLVEVCGGRACGETVLLTWLLSVSRGDTWLFLPDLVEVRDVGACVVRLWSHVVAPVFRELLCLSGCSSFASALLEFLLFWLLFEFIAYLTGLNSNPSGSSDPWVAARPSGSLAGVQEVASIPVGSECELQESVATVAGCACFERGCYFAHAAVRFVFGLRASVVGIFARAKQMLVCRVAPLVEHCDTYLWLLPALCWLVVNSGEVLPEFLSVGSGGGLRYAVVVLAGAFWWVFQNGALVVLVEGSRPVWLVVPFLGLRLLEGGLWWVVLFRLEPWCIVLHLRWLLVLVLAPCVVPCVLIVALSVVHQALVMACVRVSPLSLGSECVRFLWLHSRCVSWSDHEDDLGGEVFRSSFSGVGGWWRRRRLVCGAGASARSEEEAAVALRRPIRGFGSSFCISAVCLPSDAAIAMHVVTSEEASPRSDATLSRESGCSSLHGGCSLAVSSSVGSVGLALWAVFSGFRSMGSLGVPCVATRLLFRLVEVCNGRACGEMVLLTWLLGVSHGDTWLFLPDLVEVRDVGACVVRLWSHVVAPVFLPAALAGRDSLSQEFVVGWSWWWLVRRALPAV
ncbi:hypothetical protein Taro_052094 [Colocasia esculenta]|uniref:Uncharacterized protein n=1 Tax=Colocasia esculenta TaxID=4460 RepID=A0A843XHP3_COLES|nr:hypothetical protein [Colocasia esculenta]